MKEFFVLMGLLIFASCATVKKDIPLVGNSHENLIRELGIPDAFVDLGIGVIMLSYDNENEFFYLDPNSEQIILQRSYISNRYARSLMREMAQRLTIYQGWYYLPDYNLALRVHIDAGKYRLEIKVTDNYLTELIP